MYWTGNASLSRGEQSYDRLAGSRLNVFAIGHYDHIIGAHERVCISDWTDIHQLHSKSPPPVSFLIVGYLFREMLSWEIDLVPRHCRCIVCGPGCLYEICRRDELLFTGKSPRAYCTVYTVHIVHTSLIQASDRSLALTATETVLSGNYYESHKLLFSRSYGMRTI